MCLALWSAVAALHAPTVHRQPFIIGVAGATASGKSSVVAEIVRLLDHDHVCSITQDCFYRNLDEAEREQAYQQNYNFDHPLLWSTHVLCGIPQKSDHQVDRALRSHWTPARLGSCSG